MFIVQIYSDKFCNEYKLSLAYKFRSIDPVLNKRIEELLYLNKTVGKIFLCFEKVLLMAKMFKSKIIFENIMF